MTIPLGGRWSKKTGPQYKLFLMEGIIKKHCHEKKEGSTSAFEVFGTQLGQRVQTSLMWGRNRCLHGRKNEKDKKKIHSSKWDTTFRQIMTKSTTTKKTKGEQPMRSLILRFHWGWEELATLETGLGAPRLKGTWGNI